MTGELFPTATADNLLRDLRQIIEDSKLRISQSVNSELVLLYWNIGCRLRDNATGGDRGKYGEQIIETIAKSLSNEFGRGFSKRNIYHMVRFVEVFPDFEIVQSLIAQLGWTHLQQIISLDDPLKRKFYTELCRIERWTVRTLKDKINGMLYERTAIAKKPEKVIEQTLNALQNEQRMSPDLVFRDPYILDFLGLPADHSEQDFESSILRELETFLVELGQGFSFIARQKRMQIGSDDYYLDLLFFHRPLRALVAIELKLGKFDARDKGQMELYLRWLDRYERQPDENPPLGLILCADKNEEQVELLELSEGSIRVASYLTELPPRELLEKKLTESIQHARQRTHTLPLNLTPHDSPSEPEDNEE